jgi:hypothetical protein
MVQAQGATDQSCAKTRAEVKKECVDFMSTHTWDEGISNYVLKPGAKTPEGVMTREEVKGERDKFFRNNRWNAAAEKWEPLKAPRDIAKLSREEVRKETAAFMKTHRWDEGTNAYVDVPSKK